MAGSLDTAHLADLHALAAELDVERYRMLQRDELVAAILERDPDAVAPDRVEPPASGSGSSADDGQRGSDDGRQPTGQRSRPRSRGGRGGGGRNRRGNAAEEGDARRDEPDRDEGDEPEEQVTGEPVSGILDITPRGHGFIRLSGLEGDANDVYVSPSQIRRCEMSRGDEVAGPARPPRRGERYPALIHVDTINGAEPGADQIRLADATPVHPSRRIRLSAGDGAVEDGNDSVLLRSIDLLWPLAHGQRVLVRSAAGAGRTTLLRALARALASREDLELVVLLIDERPEEVAAWNEAAPDAEVAIATGDMRSGEQLRLVELAFGRATRRAEAGADVVLLVDSLSRIAVAADDPGRVKPIFGAGRETSEEGLGSLTVVATALTDGADDGATDRALETTQSSLLVLDRELAAAGIYPSIDVTASRISGEEELREEAELSDVRALRAELADLDPAAAAARLRELIDGSPDNEALLASLAS